MLLFYLQQFVFFLQQYLCFIFFLVLQYSIFFLYKQLKELKVFFKQFNKNFLNFLFIYLFELFLSLQCFFLLNYFFFSCFTDCSTFLLHNALILFFLAFKIKYCLLSLFCFLDQIFLEFISAFIKGYL